LSYGTPLVPKNPAEAVREGDFNDVPVISGGNHDEMRSFIGGVIQQNGAISKERYAELMRNSFGDQAEVVMAEYPLSDFDNPSLAWATLATDVSWACQTYEGDRQLAEHTEVYAYEFADPNAPNVNQINVPEFPQAAAHANDLPYLFDLQGTDMLTTPEQEKLAAQMIGYWTSFAHDGAPKADDSPSWSGFDGEGPVMSLKPDPGPTDFAADHKCGFWQGLES
ncbi:MAG: carboxylesterase family protein, partial [Stackebrandtia sp.]